MATIQELRLAQKQVDDLQAKLEKKLEFRTEVLAELLREGGSPATLARETGMARSRIYQLIDTHGIERPASA